MDKLSIIRKIKYFIILTILTVIVFTAVNLFNKNKSIKINRTDNPKLKIDLVNKKTTLELISIDSVNNFKSLVFDAKKSELDSLISNLKLPSSSSDYAINLAVNKIIEDSIKITEHDIFLVTIYTHLILGYNREAVYFFQNNKWNYLKDESDIVRFYSSCSQNYWIAQKYDSLKNKSEIRVNTFFDKTFN